MVLIGRGDVGHGNGEAVVRRHSAARYVLEACVRLPYSNVYAVLCE